VGEGGVGGGAAARRVIDGLQRFRLGDQPPLPDRAGSVGALIDRLRAKYRTGKRQLRDQLIQDLDKMRRSDPPEFRALFREMEALRKELTQAAADSPPVGENRAELSPTTRAENGGRGR
jgi:hypothetical protein